jgi:exosome complex exonuclease DIS3/RRP44
MDNINKRHRMAQMAGRASVEFYVGLALKSRGERGVVEEDAFVIRVFRNGVGVFVSSYVKHSLPSFWCYNV